MDPQHRLPLTSLLDERSVPRLALVGGGGKTSLMFALAEKLAGRGDAVLCLTTTHIRPPDPRQSGKVLTMDCCAGFEAFLAELARSLRPGRVIVAAARLLPEQNKLKGFLPAAVDALSAKFSGVPLLIEADGAAGHPLKAPAEHEPVIPSCANLVAAVVGLDAADRPLHGMAQRTERIAALTGLKTEEPFTAEGLARLALHPDGLLKGTPGRSGRCVFCNKAEVPGGLAFAARAAKLAGQSGTAWFAGSAREGWCVRLALAGRRDSPQGGNSRSYGPLKNIFLSGPNRFPENPGFRTAPAAVGGVLHT